MFLKSVPSHLEVMSKEDEAGERVLKDEIKKKSGNCCWNEIQEIYNLGGQTRASGRNPAELQTLLKMHLNI